MSIYVVYPRVCGGTVHRFHDGFEREGLSPRVRGNHAAGAVVGVAARVYPRVCGGTLCTLTSSSSGPGLSPRVRGNPCAMLSLVRSSRSIPACAGEPSASVVGLSLSRVYPRVCGGTLRLLGFLVGSKGLSPRVRGNLFLSSRASASGGSIPACAGEPCNPRRPTPGRRVYPRVCGGTRRGALRVARRAGLSPRVRGNLRLGHYAERRAGSIPACAGEPGDSPPAPCAPEVYPRVCGGT